MRGAENFLQSSPRSKLFTPAPQVSFDLGIFDFFAAGERERERRVCPKRLAAEEKEMRSVTRGGKIIILRAGIRISLETLFYTR